MRKAFGGLLIMIGLIVVGAAFYMRFEANREQQKLKNSFRSAMEGLQEASPTGAIEEEEQDKQAVGGGNQQKEITPIAMITIPKIKLEAVVAEGTGDRLLNYALGHFTGTAMPGEKGNFSVAGHRTNTYGQHFNRIHELSPGDIIMVESSAGAFEYSITESFIVNPDEVWVLNSSKESTITLVTCTPGGKQRVIVKGELNK